MVYMHRKLLLRAHRGARVNSSTMLIAALGVLQFGNRALPLKSIRRARKASPLHHGPRRLTTEQLGWCVSCLLAVLSFALPDNVMTKGWVI